MRALFFVLLLANVAFFAWSRYYAPADGSTDRGPLTRQIEPEKLRIVGPGEPVSSLPKPASALASTGSTGSACLEWGGFTVAEAPRAEKAMEPLALGPRLAVRRSEESAGWWVFIPPQANRPAAMKKAAELKALGIEEYFVVQEESPNRWAISLGIFRTEEAAQAHLEGLRARGVRSAQVGARDAHVPRVWLQVKQVDAPLHARLKEIAGAVEGSELRDCTPN